MSDEPMVDTAEPCADHPGCIRAFKRHAVGQLGPLAGWWHLAWREDDRTWRMTDPTGETRAQVVPPGEHPLGALINSVPGLVFADIVTTIEKRNLFPPPP